MNVAIRLVEKDDIGQVVDLWNAALSEETESSQLAYWFGGGSHLGEQRIAKMLRDHSYRLFAADGGQGVVGMGVVRAKPRNGTASLRSVVVQPSLRRQGVGSRLLESIEAHVREEEKKSIELHACMLLGTSGFNFFVKRGYAPTDHRELLLRLPFDEFSLRPEITARRLEMERGGIEIRYYREEGDWESLSKLLQTHFPRWMSREDTKKHPFLVAVHRERMIGFASFVVVERDGRSAFSPGVDPEYRGRGIGKVLANVWGAEVKKLGAKESVISTGTSNYPAQRIYYEMGYQKLGEMCWRMMKELTEE